MNNGWSKLVPHGVAKSVMMDVLRSLIFGCRITSVQYW